VRDRKGLSVHLLTLQRRGPRWSFCAPPTDSPSAATRLQRGTALMPIFLLRAASCFGWKTLKAAPPDASTARSRRKRYMVEAAACMVQYSMAAWPYVPAITQQPPTLDPLPPTPTPPGWASPCSLALHNSHPKTTRCGLSRDTLPHPLPRITLQAADARSAFAFHE
jgi:hypothetical protein